MADKGIYHHQGMGRTINIAAALFCLVCVIALCIAPSVDIPDTTLKSLQIILFMMLTLTGGVYLFAGIIHSSTSVGSSLSIGKPAALFRFPPFPIQANCVQQC